MPSKSDVGALLQHLVCVGVWLSRKALATAFAGGLAVACGPSRESNRHTGGATAPSVKDVIQWPHRLCTMAMSVHNRFHCGPMSRVRIANSVAHAVPASERRAAPILQVALPSHRHSAARQAHQPAECISPASGECAWCVEKAGGSARLIFDNAVSP